MRVPEVEAPAVVVPLGRLDRAALAALAYARSISADVTALYVPDDARESRLIRQRWGGRDDGISLRALSSSGSLADRIDDYIARHAPPGSTRATLVVLPLVIARPRWLFPLLNWRWLALARGLRRRRSTSVLAAPYFV